MQYRKSRTGHVKDTLGISTETLRYWRKYLDPLSTRSYFTPEDIFVYRIMYELIRKRKMPIVELKKGDWEALFSICNETSYEALCRCIVAFNLDNKTLQVIPEENAPDPYDANYAMVHMKNIFKDHQISMLENGKPKNNVISFNRVQEESQAQAT